MSKRDFQKHPHCQNCGSINPECYPGFEYTSCCNEAICDGLEKYIFFNQTISLKACCWADAQARLEAKGIDILTLPGMQRTEINPTEF